MVVVLVVQHRSNASPVIMNYTLTLQINMLPTLTECDVPPAALHCGRAHHRQTTALRKVCMHTKQLKLPEGRQINALPGGAALPVQQDVQEQGQLAVPAGGVCLAMQEESLHEAAEALRGVDSCHLPLHVVHCVKNLSGFCPCM